MLISCHIASQDYHVSCISCGSKSQPWHILFCSVRRGGHDPLKIIAPKGVGVEPALTSLRAFHGAHGNWPKRKDVRTGGDALARKAAAAAEAWAGMSSFEQEKLRRDFTAEIEWLVRKPPLGVGGQAPGPGLDAGGHDPALSASVSMRAVLGSLQVFYGEHGSWPSRRAAGVQKLWAQVTEEDRGQLRATFADAVAFPNA